MAPPPQPWPGAGGSRVIGIHSARAPLLYGGQVAQAILKLKGGESHLARPLGQLMRSLLPPVDAVVPVPLHRRRLITRGYNQAALLARAACGSQHRVRHDLLHRIRDTPAQRELTPRERWANVQGAFTARPGARGLRLLLVDDVATTGATAAACAAALRGAGAVEVHLLTLARAVP